jgi:hypothetical protein
MAFDNAIQQAIAAICQTHNDPVVSSPRQADDGLLDSHGTQAVISNQQAQRPLNDRDTSAPSLQAPQPWWRFWHSTLIVELVRKVLMQGAFLSAFLCVMWFKGLLPSQQKQSSKAPMIAEVVVEDAVDEGLID